MNYYNGASEQAVVSMTRNGGRIIYLSLNYAGDGIFQNPLNLRSPGGPGDSLLENAIFWASGYTAICPGGCNSGICVPNGGSGACDCSGTGYQGSNCQFRMNFFLPSYFLYFLKININF